MTPSANIYTSEGMFMPYKFHQTHQHHIKKQSPFRGNWSQYNESLKDRGSMMIWLSNNVIENWYKQDRVYDGTGTPTLYTEMSIVTYMKFVKYLNCHYDNAKDSLIQ
jgi:hypothetical protein